jgi:hypothetical protein
VGWLFETKSVTQTQRYYRTQFNKPWPPRSLDITPLGFFLWGYVKSNVFRTPVNRLDYLKTHIRNAILAIPADMLVWTFSVLPREPTSRSTEVNKKLPEFQYDMPQTACG